MAKMTSIPASAKTTCRCLTKYRGRLRRQPMADAGIS